MRPKDLSVSFPSLLLYIAALYLPLYYSKLHNRVCRILIITVGKLTDLIMSRSAIVKTRLCTVWEAAIGQLVVQDIVVTRHSLFIGPALDLFLDVLRLPAW
jgi:hypothetical protein